MAPSATVLWERVVYPDGNRDAVAALSALLAPDVQLTAPDVQVLPADASPALEAALWAVEHAPPATIVLVCDTPGADFDSACERLRPRGYECVVVCARPRHAGHRAWPAIQGRLPVVPLKPADVAAVVEQFQHASPWRTALDTEPVWLAGKRAALERDVLPRVAGGRDALERAEAAGSVFRGGEAPYAWVLSAATAFGAQPQALAPQTPSPPVTGGGGHPFPQDALKRLAEDLRAWLAKRPWPHEAVLSRSGIAPFLASLRVPGRYPAPPVASHVRLAVGVYGPAARLDWRSSPERNNGALIVRARDAPSPTSPYELALAEAHPSQPRRAATPPPSYPHASPSPPAYPRASPPTPRSLPPSPPRFFDAQAAARDAASRRLAGLHRKLHVVVHVPRPRPRLSSSTDWRNGSAWDSSPEGYAFESRIDH